MTLRQGPKDPVLLTLTYLNTINETYLQIQRKFLDSSQLIISLTLVSNQFLDLILTNGARTSVGLILVGPIPCDWPFQPFIFRSDFFNPLAKKKITKKLQFKVVSLYKPYIDSLVISQISCRAYEKSNKK